MDSERDSLLSSVNLPSSNGTRSFWIDTPGSNPLATEGSTGLLTHDADICIIGSGMTGTSAAWHLSRMLKDHHSEVKIVILEAREFCSGATGRNGGHLIPRAFLGFSRLQNRYNTAAAVKSFNLESYTVNSLVTFLKKRNLEAKVDIFNGGRVKLFRTRDEELSARRDFAAATAAGLTLRDVRWIDNCELTEKYGLNPSLNYSGLFLPGYSIWPSKLVTELYLDAQTTSRKISINLHTRTPVTSISRRETSQHCRPWTLNTHRGNINCSYILHATNAYAGYLLPFFDGLTALKTNSYRTTSEPQCGITPTRSHVAAIRASVPASRFLWRHGWLDGNEGWEYWFPRFQAVRNPDKDSPLIILGGGREFAGEGLESGVGDDATVNEQVIVALKGYLPGYFPGLFDRDETEDKWEMRWTGIMGFTKTEDPFVGPVLHPDHMEHHHMYAGQYIAAGYTGHGMVRAFACAEAVAGMIKAQIMREKWVIPTWLPEHYLTQLNH